MKETRTVAKAIEQQELLEETLSMISDEPRTWWSDDYRIGDLVSDCRSRRRK